MKIAFYCPNKPLDHPHPSGDLTIARSVHRALNHMGHDCREVVAFRSRWFWKTLHGVVNAARAGLEALENTRRLSPDIWLTYHPYYKSPDVLGPWISSLRHIPYVLFQPMYGTKHRRKRETRVGFHLNRFSLQRSDHLITNNQLDVPSLERIAPRHRITHLPPGIFPEEFQRDLEARKALRAHLGISDDLPVIITVARFRADVKLQSLTLLFRALSLMSQKLPTFRIMVAGDGPKEREVHRTAHDQLPGRVIFLGKIERERLHRYYSAADLFVFPGIGESLGMVYLEAQSCGLPVVALKGGGVSQVVQDGTTGLLVEGSSPELLADAVESLLRDPERLHSMGSAARRFIRTERNLWTNYAGLGRILEELVERGRRTG